MLDCGPSELLSNVTIYSVLGPNRQPDQSKNLVNEKKVKNNTFFLTLRGSHTEVHSPNVCLVTGAQSRFTRSVVRAIFHLEAIFALSFSSRSPTCCVGRLMLTMETLVQAGCIVLLFGGRGGFFFFFYWWIGKFWKCGTLFKHGRALSSYYTVSTNCTIPFSMNVLPSPSVFYAPTVFCPQNKKCKLKKKKNAIHTFLHTPFRKSALRLSVLNDHN